MREKVSVCVTTGNEEDNIGRCLESVRWADEIVVVDSCSTDRTVEICREYTDCIYEQEWLGYVRQKRMAIERTVGPWVLLMDADEEVSERLRSEIFAALESPEAAKFAGYEFRRLVPYLGRWIRHGEFCPDIKLRLFRKDRGRCVGRDPHDRIEVDGRVRRLKGFLHHYTYRNIAEHIATMNRFSTIMAEEAHAAGRKARIWDLLLRPPVRFFRSYVWKHGFLDGFPGILIAMTGAYGTFIKYSKLWELDHRKAAPPAP